MPFEELLTRFNLLMAEMENQPEDAHELFEQLHMELNQLKATGQPLPEDLLKFERQLERELEARSDKGSAKG
ncbi:MAG: hypothetical protein HKN05_14380 [Rhizobiales bacterium]|nr:hypothetical protein [Hyphomicrobiales bacterium]